MPPPEIKTLGAREREHVVINEVAVRKIDDRADHDGEDVRDEAFVTLIHGRAARVPFIERGPRRRLEIHHSAAQVRKVARARRARSRDVGPPLDRLVELANLEPAPDAACRLSGHGRRMCANDGHAGDHRNEL